VVAVRPDEALPALAKRVPGTVRSNLTSSAPTDCALLVLTASTNLNQYRPAGFGLFGHTMALVFDGVAYADIPADLTLTIDTDYF
jgi:hypothetical protein